MNAQVRQLNVEVRGRPTPAYRWSDEIDAASDSRAALALVRRREDNAIGFVADPQFDEIDGIMSDPEVDLLGLLPPLYPERLGDAELPPQRITAASPMSSARWRAASPRRRW